MKKRWHHSLHDFVRRNESFVERLHAVCWYILFQDDNRNNLLARWTSNRLITALDLKTFIKRHHVYKDIWTLKQVEQLDVLMEPDNQMDKFTACVKINERIVGYLKERYIRKVCRDNLLLPAQWCVLKGFGKSYW